MRPVQLMALAGLLCSASPAPAPRTAAPKLGAIVVAERPLRAGETVQMADLHQISVPSEWVTTSYVKPESARYIVDQKLRLPLAAGDPMLWAAFDLEKNPLKCLETIGAADTALEQIARHRAAILGTSR